MRIERSLLASPELLALAERVVWFKEPSAALADSKHFIAHALTYGTFDDIQVLRKFVDDDQLRDALRNAPAGVFDPRSWAYWNLVMGLGPTVGPPQRVLP